MDLNKVLNYLVCISILIVGLLTTSSTNAENASNNPTKDSKKNKELKKKSILDYSDADMERLYESWEEGDEDELEPDEMPHWKRPSPKIDMSKVDLQNPEAVLKASKLGQVTMMFVTISGNPTQSETQSISGLWESSLFNANLNVQRYVVGENKVLFVLEDGANAWPIKDFLIRQDRCEKVTIDKTDYQGKGSLQPTAAKNGVQPKFTPVKTTNVGDSPKESINFRHGHTTEL